MSVERLLQSLAGGVVVALLNVTTAFSIAALLFAGQPREMFLAGATVLLLSTAVAALAGALFCGYPATIVAPRSGLAPIQATTIALIGASDLPAVAVLPTMLASIMVTTIGAGVFLFLVGHFRLGALIRYIPYPVIAGFFAGIGLIFVLAGMAVATGQGVSLAMLGHHLRPDVANLTVAALGAGLLFLALEQGIGRWWVVPTAILVVLAAFYGLLALLGLDLGQAAALGWLPEREAASLRLPPLRPVDFALLDWGWLWPSLGAVFAVAVLSAFMLLIDVSAIELVADTELSPDRELKVTGLTNIFVGLLGGYTSVHTVADTSIAGRLAGPQRMTALIYAGLVVLVLAAGPVLVGVIPPFLLGALLIHLGIDFLLTWVWRRRRDMPLQDFAVVLAILVAIAFVGLLEGIALGCGLAVLLFVINYSRLPVIKAETTGEAFPSIVTRQPDARAILAREVYKIRILRLQGYLFFGSADKMLAAIRARLGEGAGKHLRYLILDFTHVSDLDSSAVQAFVRLDRIAARRSLRLVLTGLEERARARLDAMGFFSRPRGPLVRPTLTDGFTWCEASILDRRPMTIVPGADLLPVLSDLIGQPAAAEALVPFFERLDQTDGDWLFRQGETGRSLFVIASGTASVVVERGVGMPRVVQIYEHGTVLGEMALFTGDARTASVRIDGYATVFRLGLPQFNAAVLAEPAAAAAFQAFILRLMAERLESANKALLSTL